MIKILEYIWIGLVTLTIFAYLLGYLKIITTTLVAVLLLSTFIKGALISDYFMGLKDVGMKYRMIPMLWLGIVLSSIALAFYA